MSGFYFQYIIGLLKQTRVFVSKQRIKQPEIGSIISLDTAMAGLYTSGTLCLILLNLIVSGRCQSDDRSSSSHLPVIISAPVGLLCCLPCIVLCCCYCCFSIKNRRDPRNESVASGFWEKMFSNRQPDIRSSPRKHYYYYQNLPRFTQPSEIQ